VNALSRWAVTVSRCAQLLQRPRGVLVPVSRPSLNGVRYANKTWLKLNCFREVDVFVANA